MFSSSVFVLARLVMLTFLVLKTFDLVSSLFEHHAEYKYKPPQIELSSEPLDVIKKI